MEFYTNYMEKQEIRTFGRRHGKKLSARKQYLLENVLPAIFAKNTETAGNFNILEIGFGAGEHVRTLAHDNPTATVIGAEPFVNGVAALLGAMTDVQTNEILPEYKNIRIYPDDVREFLRTGNMKFKQIWVLHPDPWPKAKHEKRRLLQTEFINLLASHLTDDGKIIIGTDHWGYYDWILTQVAQTDLNTTVPDISTIETRYQHKNMAETDGPKYLVITR